MGGWDGGGFECVRVWNAPIFILQSQCERTGVYRDLGGVTRIVKRVQADTVLQLHAHGRTQGYKHG